MVVVEVEEELRGPNRGEATKLAWGALGPRRFGSVGGCGQMLSRQNYRNRILYYRIA